MAASMVLLIIVETVEIMAMIVAQMACIVSILPLKAVGYVVVLITAMIV